MPSEKFHVRLVPEDGASPYRVVVEIGMEGFNMLSSEGGRVLRKYPLHHISRWSLRGTSLILFTKSPVDVEDRTLTLQGDEHTIRSVLDMLTCCCMQMAELLQSGQAGVEGGSSQSAASSLNALLKKSKRPTLLTADQVEFWHHADKQGWMYSQGEHIKTWRKRWFVLKQGFLFRFADTNVTPSSKPRGIVDLSQVTDVSDGTSTTGRPNSIKLSTATGSTCYLAENETAQVEWVSALEGTVARLVRTIAGIDDEPAKPSSLADQLMQSYSAAAGSSGGAPGGMSGGGGSSAGRRTSGSKADGFIRVVNYDARAEANGGGGGGGGGHYQQHQPSLGGSGGSGFVSINYGNVAGASWAPETGPTSGPYGDPPRGGEPSGGMYPTPGAPSAPTNGGPYGGRGGWGQPSGGYGGGGYDQAPTLDAGYQQHQQHQQPYYSAPSADYGGGQQMGGMQPGGGQHMSLFDAVTTPAAAPPAAAQSMWQVHYTGEGRPYYYNTETGITSWDAPNV